MSMAFDTETGRARFFETAKTRGGVEPGTAFNHAQSTRLGVWGSSDMLKRDCAAIFAHELQTVHHLPKAPPAEIVLQSRAFHTYFAQARELPDLLLHVAERQAGIPVTSAFKSNKGDLLLGNAHQAVYNEIADALAAHQGKPKPDVSNQEKPANPFLRLLRGKR